MTTKSLLGAAGLVTMLVWCAPAASPRAGTQALDQPAPATNVGAPQADQVRQPRTQLQAQIDALDLQKRQLEEQTREQIRQIEEQVAEQAAQLKKDLASQIEQLQRQAKRQVVQTRNAAKWQSELLEAQKKVLEAEAWSARATGHGVPGTEAGPTPAGQKAGSDAIEEKLNRILDRLERLEKRLDKLEKK
jgi:hypothetical protein